MSDANLATIAYGAETTLGTASTALQELRYTKESLKFEKESVSSAEIRADRQVSDNQKVFGQPSGGFDFELSFGFILPWLAAALQAEWQIFTATVAATLNSGTQLITAAAGTFTNVQVGQIIKIAGAITAGNNGNHRVIAKATDGSTLTLVAGSLVATDGSASLTFTGKSVRNGVTRKSHTLEKRLLNSEGADYYQQYRGMVVDTLSLNIESKAIITGSVGMVGTVYDIADIGIDAGALNPVAATGTLTLTGNAVANETVTIGGQVYTFKAALTASNQILIGAAATDTLDNLIAAINGAAGAGSTYGTGTIQNIFVSAAAGAGDTMVVTARTSGAIGNAVATTETLTNGSWGAATLAGGVTQSAGYAAAELGPVMNGTNNVGTIRMDGAAATDRFKSIKIEIANNVRGKDACGFEGNWDIGMGQFKVTGNLNAYFRNNDLPTKIKNHTTFALDFYVQDALGNRLYFYAPGVKPASGDPMIQGINTDVMLDTSYEAILGGAENPTGATLIIDAIQA